MTETISFSLYLCEVFTCVRSSFWQAVIDIRSGKSRHQTAVADLKVAEEGASVVDAVPEEVVAVILDLRQLLADDVGILGAVRDVIHSLYRGLNIGVQTFQFAFL